jgi:hypothetical protein
MELRKVGEKRRAGERAILRGAKWQGSSSKRGEEVGKGPQEEL